jgi:hypothetical protein
MDVTEDDETQTFLQKDYEVPFITLSGMEIPQRVIALLPKALVRRHQAVPVSREGSTLVVAMYCLSRTGKRNSPSHIMPFGLSHRQGDYFPSIASPTLRSAEDGCEPMASSGFSSLLLSGWGLRGRGAADTGSRTLRRLQCRLRFSLAGMSSGWARQDRSVDN